MRPDARRALASFDADRESLVGQSSADRAPKLEAENARLREALQALVDAADDARWVTNTSMMDVAIKDARAALQHGDSNDGK